MIKDNEENINFLARFSYIIIKNYKNFYAEKNACDVFFSVENQRFSRPQKSNYV